MPAPINSPRTRVIETPTGYVAQMGCDGLTWFDLPDPTLFLGADTEIVGQMKYYATRMAMAAQGLPSSGRVCWTSDGK